MVYGEGRSGKYRTPPRMNALKKKARAKREAIAGPYAAEKLEVVASRYYEALRVCNEAEQLKKSLRPILLTHLGKIQENRPIETGRGTLVATPHPSVAWDHETDLVAALLDLPDAANLLLVRRPALAERLASDSTLATTLAGKARLETQIRFKRGDPARGGETE